MTDVAVKKQLKRAKEMACMILWKAGYRVEKTHNVSFCITAMRESEWRIVAVGTQEMINCGWFVSQRKKLESLPTPDPKLIQKEIWIREKGEHNFKIYTWKNNRWMDEELKPAELFR